jgi:hypothetical protein
LFIICFLNVLDVYDVKEKLNRHQYTLEIVSETLDTSGDQYLKYILDCKEKSSVTWEVNLHMKTLISYPDDKVL